MFIEEWFYISVPLIFYVLRSATNFSTKKIILFTIVLVIVADTVYRTIITRSINDFENWNFYPRQGTIYRFDSIMYGLLAAYLSYYNLWKNKRLLFALGIILWAITFASCILPYNTFFKYCFLSFQCIGTLFLIPVMSELKSGKGFLYKFLTFTSTISYSMYLLNLTPYKLLTNNISDKFYIGAGEIIFTFLGGYLMYRFVEKPFMDIRDKKRKMILV